MPCAQKNVDIISTKDCKKNNSDKYNRNNHNNNNNNKYERVIIYLCACLSACKRTYTSMFRSRMCCYLHECVCECVCASVCASVCAIHT